MINQQPPIQCETHKRDNCFSCLKNQLVLPVESTGDKLTPFQQELMDAAVAMAESYDEDNPNLMSTQEKFRALVARAVDQDSIMTSEQLDDAIAYAFQLQRKVGKTITGIIGESIKSPGFEIEE